VASWPVFDVQKENLRFWLATTRRLCGAERELAHVHRSAPKTPRRG
jgi:hypothetical protein